MSIVNEITKIYNYNFLEEKKTYNYFNLHVRKFPSLTKFSKFYKFNFSLGKQAHNYFNPIFPKFKK